MRECDLSKPVVDWLRARGCRVYAEVPCSGRSIDLVGLSDDLVIAVELKFSLSMSVLNQALSNCSAADESWCCVASTPKPAGFARADQWGLGVLGVADGVLRVLANPPAKRRRDVWDPARRELRRRCEVCGESDVGGVATQEGTGPAQDVYAEVQRLRSAEPGITWPELYKRVPNHYASPKSLQQSMAKVELRRDWKLRVDRGRAEVSP